MQSGKDRRKVVVRVLGDGRADCESKGMVADDSNGLAGNTGQALRIACRDRPTSNAAGALEHARILVVLNLHSGVDQKSAGRERAVSAFDVSGERDSHRSVPRQERSQRAAANAAATATSQN